MNLTLKKVDYCIVKPLRDLQVQDFNDRLEKNPKEFEVRSDGTED